MANNEPPSSKPEPPQYQPYDPTEVESKWYAIWL